MPRRCTRSGGGRRRAGPPRPQSWPTSVRRCPRPAGPRPRTSPQAALSTCAPRPSGRVAHMKGATARKPAAASSRHGPQRGAWSGSRAGRGRVPDARLQVVRLDRPGHGADHRGSADPTGPRGARWRRLSGLPGRADPLGEDRRAAALNMRRHSSGIRAALGLGPPPQRETPVCAVRNARRGAGAGPQPPIPTGRDPGRTRPRASPGLPSGPSSHPPPPPPPGHRALQAPPAGRARTRPASARGSAWWPWRSSSG
jgi:hypothetical protein